MGRAPRPRAPAAPPASSLILLASLAFAVASALVKALGHRLPLLEVAFFRSAFAIGPIVIALRARGAPLGPKRWRTCLSRGVLGTIAMLLYFHALRTIPLGDAAVLGQTAPIFVALIAPFVLSERTAPRTWIAIVASFVGVALVAAPSGTAGGGAAAALASGLVGALAHVAIRLAATQNEDPDVIALAFPVVASIGLGTCAWTFEAPSAGEWATLAAIGVLSGIGQLWMTRAFARGPLAPAAAATYLAVAMSWAIGVGFFEDPITFPALAGSAAVSGAGLWLRASGTSEVEAVARAES